MQIGSPGTAYGPSSVMSRPTVGRVIQPLPMQAKVRQQGGVIDAANRIPASAPFNPNLLRQELARRVAAGRQQRSALRGGAFVNRGLVQGGAFVPQPVGAAVPAPFTVDPSALLARARLAALLRAEGNGV